MNLRETIQTMLELSYDETLVPNISNTMQFWHGGNLDDYNDIIIQKHGRYEFGAGLYLTTRYDTAIKYAKGSRKLYLVTVSKGVEISETTLNYEQCLDFIKYNIVKGKQKEVVLRLQKYNKDNFVSADIFNNLMLNSHGLPATKTANLRSFLLENNIDYELVDSPFGFGSETMMVLYNMKKIVNVKRITSSDKITTFDLKN